MRAAYEQQLETVDPYIVETNLYTSYNQCTPPTTRRSCRTGGPTCRTRTQMKGSKASSFVANTTPSAVDPNRGDSAERLTYYVDPERHVPVRMVMHPPSGQQGPGAASVTVNFTHYQTTDGLTLPHRMKIQVATNMSESSAGRCSK